MIIVVFEALLDTAYYLTKLYLAGKSGPHRASSKKVFDHFKKRRLP